MHLDLDLRTGEYSIANAGHPSPARYISGRARWTVLDGGRGPEGDVEQLLPRFRQMLSFARVYVSRR